MGLNIDWGPLIAPLVIKVVEALVAAFIKWLESQPAEKACLAVEGLAAQLVYFEEAEHKTTAAVSLATWMADTRTAVKAAEAAKVA